MQATLESGKAAKAGALAVLLALAAGVSAGPWITGEDGSGLPVASATANDPPQASFTSSCDERECVFDGSGSSDPDGSIASYHWDFGDGSTAGGETVGHTYANDGEYTITLTVTDDDGATDQESQTLTVEDNARPVASFSASCDELTCHFDGSASYDEDGTIASYEWDFGDGSTGVGETTEHTYDSGGSYEVVLTVTDDDGESSTYTLTVQPSGPPDSMHVHAIEHGASGPHVVVEVEIYDGQGTPVSNAAVQAKTCNTVVVCRTNTQGTGSNGQATFTFEFGVGGLYETCVLELDHATATYDPASDHARDGNCATDSVTPGGILAS